MTQEMFFFLVPRGFEKENKGGMQVRRMHFKGMRGEMNDNLPIEEISSQDEKVQKSMHAGSRRTASIC